MKSENNTYQLFTPSGCLTLDALKRYQSKSLSVKELKLAEDHIGECEFCLDTIEGIGLLSDKDKLESIVSEINENLIKGLKDQETSKKAGLFFISNKAIYFSAAASVIILVGLFSYFQFYMNNPEQSDLAIKTYQIDEIPIPKDENDIIIEEYLEISEDINRNFKNNKSKTAATKKQEKREPTKKSNPSIKEKQYKPELEKVRTADSGTEAFLANEANAKNTIAEPVHNGSVDIASTQPLEYYIAGITISEKANEEMGDLQENEDLIIEETSMSAVRAVKKGKASSEQIKQSNKQTSEQTISKSESANNNVDQLSNENHFFDAVGEKPEFRGGEEGLINYLSRNLRYPNEAKSLAIQGIVLVSFIVEENGEVTSVKVLHGIGGGCDEEAKRVISKMPSWTPAVKDGKSERVLFKMPISFRLY